MNDDMPFFILAGNGPYDNRGCEAIVRGTMKILREHFKDPSFLCLSHSLSNKQRYMRQVQSEFDPKIVHKQIHFSEYKFSKERFIRWYLLKFKPSTEKYHVYRDMLPELDQAQAVLSIGGDNYSLDYGIPKFYTDLDDVVQSKKKSLILWGASIGPFDAIPDYKPYIIDHLKKVEAIFARESATIKYLEKNGIKDNVYSVADPAYLLDPVKPKEINKKIEVENNSIGINFSPLMAKYVCNGDIKVWEKVAANIVRSILKTTGKTIYLIPHVTTPGTSDFVFMKNMLYHIDSPDKIVLIEPIYNASETKWIISKLSFFAGARMHSTIASLSSRVPTLSFSYSIKSLGINRDVFGHESYCLSPDKLNADTVVKKMTLMMSMEDEIVDKLNEKIPIMEERAMNAGRYLHQILES